MDGEGLFNWRYVFQFEYMPAERTILATEKKKLFHIKKRKVESIPPVLYIQVWDNSLLHSDEYIGQLELPLLQMAPPAHDEESCSLDTQKVEVEAVQSICTSESNEDERGCVGCCFGSTLSSWFAGGSGSARAQPIDLFEKRHVKGFWPCYLEVESGGVGGRRKRELRGKVELELELLTEEEARERPVGRGRAEPNEHPHLDKPRRPQDSFIWFTSPWKSFRYIIWRHKKWLIIRWTVMLLLVGLLIGALYYLPVRYIEAMEHLQLLC